MKNGSSHFGGEKHVEDESTIAHNDDDHTKDGEDDAKADDVKHEDIVELADDADDDIMELSDAEDDSKENKEISIDLFHVDITSSDQGIKFKFNSRISSYRLLPLTAFMFPQVTTTGVQACG